MKLGFDVDGVLADFNTGYIQLIKEETSIILPEPSDSYPDVWAFDEAGGVSKEELKRIWKRISTSQFWSQLHPYPGTFEVMDRLNILRMAGNDIYFITTRPGEKAKFQTERWLSLVGMYNPTVIVSAQKGFVAKGIGLDAMLDDKPENLENVRQQSPETLLYLLDRPYNRMYEDKVWLRVPSVMEMLVREEVAALKVREAA